jgi:octaprenyl-diphosphate synthase
MEASEVLRYFRQAAGRVDQALRIDLEETGDQQLAEVLHYAVFNGGKRIRPQLVILAWQLAGRGGSEEEVLRLALAFEYLHVASLLHDDVIDHATRRRGQASVNARWGKSPAILAGDYLHSRALNLAGQAAGREGVMLMSRAITAMVEAEFLQARLAVAGQTTLDDYYRVAAGKTGALIASACESGIVLAGGNGAERRACLRYGENLGLAFQIVDDLLDYLGDPERTGKEVGNDLVEGKMTLPLLLALERAEMSDQQLLLARLTATPEARRQSFEEVRELIERYNGFESARGRASELLEEGLLALSCFPAGPERELLAGLSSYVLSRDR